MQKTPLSTLIREELIRAMVFGFSLLVLLTSGLIGVANAANG